MTLDLLVEGRIATLTGEAGFGWVDAIGIAGGRVVAAGLLRDVDVLAGTSTRRLALAPDEIVLPALRDAHIHLVEAARTVNQVDLSDAASLRRRPGDRRSGASPPTRRGLARGHRLGCRALGVLADGGRS